MTRRLFWPTAIGLILVVAIPVLVALAAIYDLRFFIALLLVALTGSVWMGIKR